MTKRDELIALDPAGLEAAVRECARITAPEISDVEYERIKADNSPRYQNTRAEMERTLRAYLNAHGDDEPAFPTWGAEDEAYELGKRDGYESAIQDLDLATGGDGEFKGSTIPGCTVDVPAMKARIVGRTNTAPPADAGMREALEQLRKEADSAYCRFLDKMSSKPCLGHEAKISNGTFGVTELEAHRHAKELLGFHRGIYHAIKALTAPGATTKSDGGECACGRFNDGEQCPGVDGRPLCATMVPTLVDDPNSASGKRVEYQRPSDPSSTRSEVTTPCGLDRPSESQCPNMKEVGGGMDGERYSCAVCGKGYYLDYDDMR